jgi:hypothetical protein
MPRAKKKVEETEPSQDEERTSEESSGPFDSSIFTELIDEETGKHLLKAGLELVQVLDKAVPKSKMPEEVKVHYRNAKKEALLMVRAMLDYKIAEMDKKGKPKKSSGNLKKIELS